MNSTYHILYVDDESDLLEVGKLFLEASGNFCVDTISSPLTALALLNSKTYDAVISDYQMPDINGIELLKKVRASGNTIPFILFTGRGREEVVIQALNEGANFYLQKGGDPDSQFVELDHQIRQAIQQRRAEANIHDLEQREANIINFLPDPTLVIDTNGVVIAWNRAMEEMTGVPAEKMLGKGDYEYAIPFYGRRQPVLIDLVFASDQDIAKGYAQITHKKDILIAETSVSCIAGKPVTLLGIASPLYDHQGKIVGAIESIRDVTDKKQAEDALKKSEEKYRTLVENVVDIVYRADSNGTLIFITPSILPLTGYDSLDDIVGRPIVSFWAYPQKRDEMIARMKETGFVKDYEVIILKKDGTEIPVSISSHFSHDNNGKIAGIEGIIRDISDRKKIEDKLRESEERFKAFMDHLPVTAFIKDQKSTNLFVNRRMTEVFGEREWIGKSVYEQFPREAAEKMISDDQQTLREGYRRNTEYLVDKKGDKKIFETHKFRIDRGNKPPLIGGFAVDITEQNLKEQERQENEQRLTSIYNTVEDSIFQLAVEGNGQYRFTSVNAAFCRTTGVSPEHVIGRNVTEIIPEPSLSLVLEKYRQAVETKAIVRWEETSEYPTGLLTGEVRIAPIVDKAGTCTHLIGSVHDITELKRAQNAWKESEEKYRSTLNAFTDAVSVVDTECKLILANTSLQSWLLALGKSNDIIGKKIVDAFPFLSPSVLEEYRTVFSTGMTIVTEETSKIGNTEIITETRKIPIKKHESVIAVVAVIRDITERKKTEIQLKAAYEQLAATEEELRAQYDTLVDNVKKVQESEMRFRKIFDNSPVGMALVTPEFRFVSVNPAFVSMTGYPECELQKMTFRDITHPDNLAGDMEHMTELAAGTIPVYSTEKRYIRKDGSILWGFVRVTAIHDPAGSLRIFIAQIDDITERKRNWEALQQTNRKLNLLSGITRHDIKNQLLSLSGYLKISKKYAGDAEKMSEFIDKEQRILSFLERQITFTKEYETIGVRAPVWQDCRILAKSASTQVSPVNALVKNDLPAGLQIFADPLIVKVFYNLLDNAVHHGGTISTIRFFREERDGDLVIVYEDDGIGVPANEKEQIFERGFGKNTGMGLFLAREILSITGITISENGEPGRGARFEMRMPKGAYRFSPSK